MVESSLFFEVKPSTSGPGRKLTRGNVRIVVWGSQYLRCKKCTLDGTEDTALENVSQNRTKTVCENTNTKGAINMKKILLSFIAVCIGASAVFAGEVDDVSRLQACPDKLGSDMQTPLQQSVFECGSGDHAQDSITSAIADQSSRAGNGTLTGE